MYWYRIYRRIRRIRIRKMKKVYYLKPILYFIVIGMSLWACSYTLLDVLTHLQIDYLNEAEYDYKNNEESESENSQVIPKVEENLLVESKPDEHSIRIYELNPDFTPLDYNSKSILNETSDFGSEYMDRMTFICDSPTYWLWPNKLLHGGKDSKQIWTGPEGTMTLAYQSTYNILDPFDNIEKPIREVVSLHKPDYLVIALGVNGISFMDKEYFIDEYSDLVLDIQEISPSTVLILQSIYPITEDYKYWGSITNTMISEANRWILSIAESTNTMYLDSFSLFFDNEGKVRKELYLKDGLHPNVDGLKLLLEYIQTHGYLPQ